MLKVPDPGLSDAAHAYLYLHQSAIDARPTFAEKKTEMEARWKNRANGENRAIWESIFLKISGMAMGGQFCNYCEHDRISRISPEHIRPKSLFPEQAFVWSNMIGACPRCNLESKKAQMAVFHPAGSSIMVKLGRKAPPSDDIALIDPRSDEDPLDLMELDFETFQFKAQKSHPQGSRAFQKVELTNRILQLDDDILARTRGNAFEDFVSRLNELCQVQSAADFPALQTALRYPLADTSQPFESEKQRLLQHARTSLSRRTHQTVLVEMVIRVEELDMSIQDIVKKANVWSWHPYFQRMTLPTIP